MTNCIEMWLLRLVIGYGFVFTTERRRASLMVPKGSLHCVSMGHGPFQVVERIGSVAYRLRLPPKTRIHDVFHIVFLKKHIGDLPAAPVALPPIAHGRALPVPAKVLRATPANNSWNLLVQWEGRSPAEATWEPLADFKESYPTFKLEEELFGLEGGSVVDTFFGKKYQRKKKLVSTTE